MLNSNITTDFFLTAITPNGFISKLNSVYDFDSSWKCYILKGVSGNGKSTILKNIAQKAKEKYQNVEKIHCPINAETLDAVIIQDLHICFVDGTSPNILEPIYPQSNHIVIPFYDTINEDILWDKRKEIISLVDKKKKLEENCQRFLSATGSLYKDTYYLALEATDIAKIYSLAKRISSKEFKPCKKPCNRDNYRFLSVVSQKGITGFFDTVTSLAEKVYVLQDDFGPSSKILLSAIKNEAISNGYEVISCYSPISSEEKLEHLFVPKLELAFITTNQFNNIDVPPYRIINSRRFTDFAKLKLKKKHLSFNKRSTMQMLAQSVELLREISSCQKEIDEIYKKAVNYDMVNIINDELLDLI
ncbi:MAG: hypothetical protein RR806_01030 [Oscillospiraceae bacterium]